MCKGIDTLSLHEKAGDYLESNVSYSASGTKILDFGNDHDVFKYSPSTTQKYTIVSNLISVLSDETGTYGLAFKIYNANGIELTPDLGSTDTRKEITLTAGSIYYFDVYSTGTLSVKYRLIVS